MRALLPCLAAFAALALFAGCADRAPPADADDGAGRTSVVVEETEPDSTEADFGWLAAVEAPVAGNAQLESSNAASLDVSEGRAVLHANVTWTCGDPGPCELHLYLCAPDDEPTACSEHTMGASPLSLEVSDPMPGEWTAALLASGGNADVSGTIALTAA